MDSVTPLAVTPPPSLHQLSGVEEGMCVVCGGQCEWDLIKADGFLLEGSV